MTDLQFSWSRKEARKLLSVLEEYEVSLRAAMPDTRLGAPALTEQEKSTLKHLEAKQDAVLPFIDILEKRLNTISQEGYNFLAKYERRAFDSGARGKDYPFHEEIPESILTEMEEHGISEEKFHDACMDTYSTGRAQFNESELYTSKCSAHIDAEEQREAAMQAGMAFGCAGYNDAMGF